MFIGNKLFLLQERGLKNAFKCFLGDACYVGKFVFRDTHVMLGINSSTFLAFGSYKDRQTLMGVSNVS